MKIKSISLFAAAPALLAGCLLATLLSPALTCQGQATQDLRTTVSPTPLPGEVWVYPTGVFPDDFYALWLAVNGAPYASGDLPFPYYGIPDGQPGARPVFIGQGLPNGKWTVVLKARRLDRAADGSCTEGPFTAFNLGLAAGLEITPEDAVLPVMYMLDTGKNRFSTGFGNVTVLRAVNVRGEVTPGGEERFFGYTPNFDPAANPDTNPDYDARWLPADYPCGSEYKPGHGCGYGLTSTKSVIYGGYFAFHVRARVDLSISDCLLYGQYGSAITEFGLTAGAVLTHDAPSRVEFSNLDIRHSYYQIEIRNDKIQGLSWPIYICGGGGKHIVKECSIDQSPTWQEYHLQAKPNLGQYSVNPFPCSYGVVVSQHFRKSPGDSVRIERSTIKNFGSTAIVYMNSDVDLLITDCLTDGGYFPVPLTKDPVFYRWLGIGISIYEPTADVWGSSPVIEIRNNDLTARAWGAWGVKLDGCGNGEVTVISNNVTCAASPLGYAGGVQLRPSSGVGSNRNIISGNVIKGIGGWALSVDTSDVPCEGNLFLDNDLSSFSAQEAGAVFFGPQANENFFSGDAGAGIVDLGTGNVVAP